MNSAHFFIVERVIKDQKTIKNVLLGFALLHNWIPRKRKKKNNENYWKQQENSGKNMRPAHQ